LKTNLFSILPQNTENVKTLNIISIKEIHSNSENVKNKKAGNVEKHLWKLTEIKI